MSSLQELTVTKYDALTFTTSWKNYKNFAFMVVIEMLWTQLLMVLGGVCFQS